MFNVGKIIDLSVFMLKRLKCYLCLCYWHVYIYKQCPRIFPCFNIT